MRNRYILINTVIFTLFLILVVWGCPSMVFASQITQAEYFIDSDPGSGAGTSIDVTPSDNLYTISEQLSPGLTAGLHTIYVRFQDDNQAWGPARGATFLVSSQSAPAYQISAAEYFIDDASSGTTPITVTNASEQVSVTEAVDLNSLSDGLHTLYVRFKDDSSGWGPARGFTFLVSNTTVQEYQITAAEYFIDDISNGTTPITVTTAGEQVTVTEDISLNALTDGIHSLYVRFKDTNTGWGPPRGYDFLVSSTTQDAYEITQAEYFIDNGPGVGNGTSMAVSVQNGTATVTQDISAADLSRGSHDIYVRFYDETNGWGPARKAACYVTDQEQEAAYIVAAEYFIDTDPGVGNGQAISAPVDGAFDENEEAFNIEADPASLSEGDHYFYIRTQDSKGRWGPARGTFFRVNAEFQPVISEAEYFFNSDPGEGNGLALPALDGAYNSLEEASEIELTVASTGLDVGDHKVYVRYKNSWGDWSSTKSKAFSIVVKPVIEVSLTALDFGLVFIQDSVQKEITIKNNGDADLEISSMTTPADFYTSFTAAQSPVSPGDSIRVTITFKPSEEKDYSGDIVINNNDANQSIAVTGSGSAVPLPKISMDPAGPCDFGEVDIFTEVSKTVTVTLTNTGTAKLWISDMTASDPTVFSHDFSGLTDSIDIDGSIHFNLTFTPQDTLAYNEIISMANNAPDSPYQYHVSGQGVGTFAPYIVTVADTLDFGTVQTGAPASKSLQITNTGTIDLEISSIVPTSADFSTNLSSANKTVSPGDTADISVNFNPGIADIYDDTLAIHSNDTPHSPKIVHVLGIGSATPVPDILVSSRRLDFGNIPLTDAPLNKSLTIRNGGTADLNITNITSDNNGFTTDFTSNLSIAPNNFHQLQVTFNPTQNIIYEGRLKIVNDDPDIPNYYVQLYGSSVFPEIFVLTSNLNFGEVAVLSASDLTMTIENAGTDTLKISEFKKTAEIDSVLTITPASYDILPSGSKNFKVTFAPVEPIDYAGEIIIINNDHPDTVKVTGTGFDNIPPEISFNTEDVENVGIEEDNAIPISTTISDNNQVAGARLFYRQGGKALFDSTDMALAGNQYSGEIPKAFVTRRGVEYYIKAFDGANTQYLPATAPQVPAVARIKVPALPSKSTQSQKYEMFSIPSELLKPGAGDLLTTILGEYDINQYRLFRWINGAYVELPDNPNFAFDPGKAYWLITKEIEVINIDTSISVKTNENFIMSLDEGWNQVGTPFYFSIAWDSVYAASPNVVQGLVAYEYDSETKSWVVADKAEKFKGYFIYTPSGGNILRFPPREANQSVSKKIPPRLAEGEWQIRIEAQASDYCDQNTLVGVRRAAADQWDILDRMDPPAIDDQYVNVYLDHSDWQTVPGKYSGDFRALSTTGHYYDFTLAKRNIASEVKLCFAVEQSLPPNFGLLLLDKAKRTGRMLQPGEEIAISGSGAARHFRLIAGTKSFCQANDLGIGITPQEFRLAQNYPNPFNPVTHIQFALPSRERVRLVVYNCLGQQIKTLIAHEIKDPGYYEMIWDGTDQAGVSVASGIYFYTLQAGQHHKTSKMVLLR